MRGRLIFPFTVRVAQLDTHQMAQDPDDAGDLTSGYDEDFAEPVTIQAASGGPGEEHRVEDIVEMKAQIEPAAFGRLEMFFSGASNDSRFVCVAHFRSLEQANLIDADGNAKIHISDRLVDVYDYKSNLVMTPRKPLYVVEARPEGFGIGMRRNLLFVAFQARKTGVPA